jgi:hypothetical protein
VSVPTQRPSAAVTPPPPLLRRVLRRARSLARRLTRTNHKRTPFAVQARRFYRPRLGRKVNVVIAGVQKGGTTALFHFVEQHPEVCTSVRKEVHYFNKHYSPGDGPAYSRYHAWFEPGPGHKVLLEATPDYTYRQECMERIQEYSPEMRLIVILRNPVDRAYSQWQMATRKRREHRPFSEVVQHHRREADRPVPHRKPFSYFERGFYARQIEAMWQRFPREQTLILRNEELLRQRDATLARVFEFAGLAPFTCADIGRGPSSYEPMSVEDRVYLEELYEPEIHALEGLLGWDCSAWLG